MRVSAFIVIALLVSRASGESFTISYWCGPPAKFNTLERYQEVKEANFTLAFPPCGGMTVEQNRKLLDFCQQVGLKAVIHDGRMVHAISGNAKATEQLDAIVKDYSDHPALFAYRIVDEPGAGAFPGLGEVVAYLKQKDPKHPGYINLLPTYGRDFNVLGTKTYEEYVRKYVEIVKPSVISYDHYHFTNHGDRADFFENLETVRKVSVESGIPFWNIVLCVQHFDYRHLTEAELRFEAMQTLAYGARGLLWFTYWSPAESDKSAIWQHAMINPDGTRDPHYDMIRKINAEVLALGAELEGAQSIEVSRSQSPPFTSGKFRKGEQTLTLVANLDYRKPVEAPLVAPAGKVERYDPLDRKWAAFSGESGQGGTHLKLELPAGGAILLRW